MTTAVDTVRDTQLRRLEREFGVLIPRVRRDLWARAREVHPDLQPATYLLLAYVARQGPSRATTLSEAMGIDKGAISRQVQHLVDLELVTRSPDPADGRASLLTATDEAVRRLDAVVDDRRAALQQRLAGWSDEQLATFVDALAGYNEALGD